MARTIEARATPEEKAAVRALETADNARHRANLADMKSAFVEKVVTLKSEAAHAASRAYADYDRFIAQFEAGLAHFAKTTGLHAEVEKVLMETREIVKEPDASS